MSAFLTGVGTGFFSGLVKQQEEARAENAKKREMTMNHYMTTMVPQYFKAKASSVRLKKQVETLIGMGYEPEVAESAVAFAGGDIDKAFEKAQSMKPAAPKAAPTMQDQLSGIAPEEGGISPEVAAEMPGGGAVAPTQQAAVAPSAPSVGATEIPGASTNPLMQPDAPISSPKGFWDSVVMGKDSMSTINAEVASEVGALYGVDGATVASWMEQAYSDPMDLAGIEAGGVTMDTQMGNRQDIYNKYMDPEFTKNIKGDRAVFDGLMKDYRENGNEEALAEARGMILGIEEIEAIEAKYAPPPTERSQNPELNRMNNQIGGRFGAFTKDAQGNLVLTELEPDILSDYLAVSAFGEALVDNGTGANAAAAYAVEAYDAGKIPGTTTYKGGGGGGDTIKKGDTITAEDGTEWEFQGGDPNSPKSYKKVE